MNAIIMAAVLSAQQFHYGHFLEGAETTVFEAGSPLLADSSVGASRIAELPAGLPVSILEPGGDWCRVEAGSGSYRFAGAGATGWVESEDLALVSLMTSDGLLQLGITGYGETGQPEGEARLFVEDGSLLSCPVEIWRFSEEGRLHYCVDASEVPSEGLSGVETAFVLSFIYEACGYLNSDILMIATTGELVQGPEAASVSEAGIFRHSSALVLPPELGEDDVVEVSTRHTEWIEEGDSLVTSLDETSFTRYGWNGRFFELEP
ncbi:MAG: SH3 domain-containing protein [Candidatus Fermentibacter sp.]|nr:SH3 domain-containing protein [Candidatus Fermentibacter sp.]